MMDRRKLLGYRIIDRKSTLRWTGSPPDKPGKPYRSTTEDSRLIRRLPS